MDIFTLQQYLNMLFLQIRSSFTESIKYRTLDFLHERKIIMLLYRSLHFTTKHVPTVFMILGHLLFERTIIFPFAECRKSRSLVRLILRCHARGTF